MEFLRIEKHVSQFQLIALKSKKGKKSKKIAQMFFYMYEKIPGIRSSNHSEFLEKHVDRFQLIAQNSNQEYKKKKKTLENTKNNKKGWNQKLNLKQV